MAYIYAADIYCDDCGDDICRRIQAEGNAPADPDDEYSYDSDEYPKRCDGESEADSPQHCGSHDDCINAVELSDGHKIGVWLENDLTSDGEDYVVEAVREARAGGGSCEVADLWEEYYSYLDFSVTAVCNGCQEDFDSDDLDENNLCVECREGDDSDDPADVVFLRDCDDGDVFAVFPGIAATVGVVDHITCYAHVGQHSAAALEYVAGCDEVTDPAEYADLADELRRVGYVLNVVRKDCIESADYRAQRLAQLGL